MADCSLPQQVTGAAHEYVDRLRRFRWMTIRDALVKPNAFDDRRKRTVKICNTHPISKVQVEVFERLPEDFLNLRALSPRASLDEGRALCAICRYSPAGLGCRTMSFSCADGLSQRNSPAGCARRR